VAHWRCLAAAQQDEILKAARDRSQPNGDDNDGEGTDQPNVKPPKDIPKRVRLDAYETTEFICNSCMKGGICMGCMEIALEPDSRLQSTDATKKLAVEDQAAEMKAAVSLNKNGDIDMADVAAQLPVLVQEPAKESPNPTSSRELLYRCFSCKRLAHYRCLPRPSSVSPPADLLTIANWYQSDTNWFCSDCSSYTYTLDKILAWRPYPPNAIEPPRPDREPPNYKSMLPREYLVKWADRSYRRIEWVPHMWLVSMFHAKLRHFLTEGAKVDLLPEPAIEEEAKGSHGDTVLDLEIAEDEPESSSTKAKSPGLPSDPIPDAELKIPLAWKTVDRVLDVLLWYSGQSNSSKARRKTRKRKNVDDDELSELTELTDEDDQLDDMRTANFETGEEPDGDHTETVEAFEDRTGLTLGMQHIDLVVWAFTKWGDLGYDDGQ
jgi:chromodomain-helicase-DNA-binding protein 4